MLLEEGRIDLFGWANIITIPRCVGERPGRGHSGGGRGYCLFSAPAIISVKLEPADGAVGP
jgi:hypothetical protein